MNVNCSIYKTEIKKSAQNLPVECFLLFGQQKIKNKFILTIAKKLASAKCLGNKHLNDFYDIVGGTQKNQVKVG